MTAGVSIAGPLPYLQASVPTFDLQNLGSLYNAIAGRYPNDRLGHTHFWQDLNYSSYSYERFFPEILNAPDLATKEALIHQKWGVDTARLRTSLNGLANFGGYFPQFRALNESHCTTVLDFQNGDIQERWPGAAELHRQRAGRAGRGAGRIRGERRCGSRQAVQPALLPGRPAAHGWLSGPDEAQFVDRRRRRGCRRARLVLAPR